MFSATHGILLPKSLVIHHIISAVVSKWPWQPLVWFLKIVFHSKYLKLQEEQNRNDWFMISFFLWLGNIFFLNTSSLQSYVQKDRDFYDTGYRQALVAQFTITSYHSQTITRRSHWWMAELLLCGLSLVLRCWCRRGSPPCQWWEGCWVRQHWVCLLNSLSLTKSFPVIRAPARMGKSSFRFCCCWNVNDFEHACTYTYPLN